MKKSTLILALVGIAFASCKKTDDVSPVTPTSEASTLATTQNGPDDMVGYNPNDDMLPKQSSADDNVKRANDDNQPRHSGKDDKSITVPAKVIASFNKLFPGSTVREWKFTSNSLYKVHFMRKGIAYEASFKANGTLVKVERNK